MTTIDYTQYRTWMTCPLLWYERYVRCLRKKRQGPRDDALAYGTLLHAGIEMYRRHQRVEIPSTVVDEITPSPECYANSMSLLTSYIQAHPMESWPIEVLEEPLRFMIADNIEGLAKVDHLFYVGEPTTINNGSLGTLTLEEGWWLRDYKTHSGYKRDLYMKGWNVNMQANFQILAANHFIKHNSTQYAECRGLLVDVIEKPRLYVPERTCKACKNKWEYASWKAQSDGTFNCPWCSNNQALDPPKRPAGYCGEPTMYAIMVQRTQEQLAVALDEIHDVANSMSAMRQHGAGVVAPNREQCINMYGECEFYLPHTFITDPMSSSDFEIFQPTKYMQSNNNEVVQ